MPHPSSWSRSKMDYSQGNKKTTEDPFPSSPHLGVPGCAVWGQVLFHHGFGKWIQPGTSDRKRKIKDCFALHSGCLSSTGCTLDYRMPQGHSITAWRVYLEGNIARPFYSFWMILSFSNLERMDVGMRRLGHERTQCLTGEM